MTNTQTDLNKTPRVRFNWGFWDGYQSAQTMNRYPTWYPQDKHTHFDQVFVSGFDAGVKTYRESAHGQTSSDTAWNEYQSGIKAAKVARQTIKAARPPLFSARY